MAAPLRALALAAATATAATGVLFGAAVRADAGTAPPRCNRTAPASAAQYARAMNAVPQAGDATLSVPLGSGRVAWIYGDTLIPGLGMPHSTVVMQDAGCFTATRTQFLPDDRDGTYWWPAAAVARPSGDVLVTAGDGYGHRMRAALARVVHGVLVFQRWLGYWPQPRTTDGPYLGTGLVVDGSRLRVYGTSLRRGSLGKALYLASVPLSRIADPTAWTIGRQAVWGTGAHGADTAIAAYHDRAGFHLFTVQDSVYGGGPVIELDGPTAAGPFTVRPLLRHSRPGQLRYNVAVHPEAQLADGRLLVTLNNNWPLTDGRAHPLSSYQPSYFAVARR